MVSRSRKCLVTFQPEAWIKDNATAIDGAFEFDVAPILDKMSEEEALFIGDNSAQSDALYDEWREAHPDPDAHRGPFTVYCESAIAIYFGKPDPHDWRNPKKRN